MLVVFDTRTGNVKRFVERIGVESVPIRAGLSVMQPFVLITYTTGFGKVPPSTAAFLSDNGQYLRGVTASGNRNWGVNFGKAADLIAEQYMVPVISKFELAGTRTDEENFLAGVRQLEIHRAK